MPSNQILIWRRRIKISLGLLILLLITGLVWQASQQFWPTASQTATGYPFATQVKPPTNNFFAQLGWGKDTSAPVPTRQLTQAYRSLITAEVKPAGFGFDGQIIDGQAYDLSETTPQIQQTTASNYQVAALSRKDAILSQSRLYLTSDNLYQALLQLPVNTAKIQLWDDQGNVWDQIIIEQQPPQIKLTSPLPQLWLSHQTLTAEFDFQPQSQQMHWQVSLINDSLAEHTIVPDQAVVNHYQLAFDWNQLQLDRNRAYRIKAVLRTPFQRQLWLSPRLTVLYRPAGRFLLKQPRSPVTAGQAFSLNWDYQAWGLDNQQQIKQFCQQYQHCYTIKWQGVGVQFSLLGSNQLMDSLEGQYYQLACLARGKPQQRITAQLYFGHQQVAEQQFDFLIRAGKPSNLNTVCQPKL